MIKLILFSIIFSGCVLEPQQNEVGSVSLHDPCPAYASSCKIFVNVVPDESLGGRRVGQYWEYDFPQKPFCVEDRNSKNPIRYRYKNQALTIEHIQSNTALVWIDTCKG